jgi:hypothetical protein
MACCSFCGAAAATCGANPRVSRALRRAIPAFVAIFPPSQYHEQQYHEPDSV